MGQGRRGSRQGARLELAWLALRIHNHVTFSFVANSREREQLNANCFDSESVFAWAT